MQKLISPINEAGQKRTLDDLLNDLSTPSRQAGKSNIFFFHPSPSLVHTLLFYGIFRITENGRLRQENLLRCTKTYIGAC